MTPTDELGRSPHQQVRERAELIPNLLHARLRPQIEQQGCKAQSIEPRYSYYDLVSEIMDAVWDNHPPLYSEEVDAAPVDPAFARPLAEAMDELFYVVRGEHWHWHGTTRAQLNMLDDYGDSFGSWLQVHLTCLNREMVYGRD